MEHNNIAPPTFSSSQVIASSKTTNAPSPNQYSWDNHDASQKTLPMHKSHSPLIHSQPSIQRPPQSSPSVFPISHHLTLTSQEKLLSSQQHPKQSSLLTTHLFCTGSKFQVVQSLLEGQELPNAISKCTTTPPRTSQHHLKMQHNLITPPNITLMSP